MRRAVGQKCHRKVFPGRGALHGRFHEVLAAEGAETIPVVPLLCRRHHA